MANGLLVSTRVSNALTVARYRGWRSNLWGFLDQATLSLTTLVTMLLLARELGASKFGVFSLVYTLYLFAGNIQSTLISSPHNVLGSTMESSYYRAYTASTAVLQSFLTLATVFLLLIGAALASVLAHGWSTVILALAISIPSLQGHEFVRRVLYTRGHGGTATLIGVAKCAGQISGLMLLWYFNRLTEVSSFLIMSIAAFLSVWLAIPKFLLHFTTAISARSIRQSLKEDWGLGKWLMGSSLASWFSGQMYPILTAGLVSIAALGASRAAGALLGPTNILMRGIESVFTPKASTVYQRHGVHSLLLYMRRITLFTFPILFLYCAVISVVSSTLVPVLFGPEYAEFSWLVIPYAINATLMYFYNLASLTLFSTQNSSPMFQAHVVSAAIVLTLGVALVNRFGLMGVAVGTVAHSLVINLVLWRCVWLLARNHQWKGSR